ncbi:MAG TPA: hypothetical protein VFQ35_11380 [Polyangiaceae bacterium]|nr:hypothetical protein [Polyangiaceae bacterium]
MNQSALLLIALAFSVSETAAAEVPSAEREDRFTFLTHSETHAQLFRRALLPGTNGTTVATETALPITQYVTLSARDIDAPWRRDSVDIEVALWGRVHLYDLTSQDRFDGDVQSANVRQRFGKFALRLGRQFVAGGAARYARFDGGDLTVDLGAGFWAEGYAGFTAMPRWNERPSYLYLGTASDSGVRSLASTPAAARDSYWQAGARVGFMHVRGDAVVSFHEQHEALGLAHRNLGANARYMIADKATLGGTAILDLDTNRFADASLFVDYFFSRKVDASLEYFHLEPSLLLSRQSVLSVFTTDAYDEFGGSVRVRPTSSLTLQGLGFANGYSDGEVGGRTELSASAWVDDRRLTFVRLAYARVLAPDNGYNSARASVGRKFGRWLMSTVEAYYYLYDREVRGARSSSVYAATLTYRPSPSVSLLGGASLARTADANVDAQGQLRLSCDFDVVRHARGL